jgi:hypothetical protein
LAVKLLVYAALLFFGMMTFLIVKEPYTLRVVDQDGNVIPEIELFNAQNYQIKTTGIESIVRSDKVSRFKDFDTLEGIHAGHVTKEGLKGVLTSDKAIVQDKVIHFLSNSHYFRDDGVALDGEDIFYDLQKEILRSDKPFIFSQKQSRTHGLSFVYQMKEGTISATNIHSIIQQVGKN